MEVDNELYDWLFHFNSYVGTWNAFLRSDYSSYLNGGGNITISAPTIEEVLALIKKKNESKLH